MAPSSCKNHKNCMSQKTCTVRMPLEYLEMHVCIFTLSMHFVILTQEVTVRYSRLVCLLYTHKTFADFADYQPTKI